MAEEKIEGWEPKGAMEEYKGYEIWDHSDFAPDRKNTGKADPDWKADPDSESGSGDADAE